MRIRGINFDTGFMSAGTTTREPFDERVVQREMQIIHDDLHCNGVRVTGGYPDRLEIAAKHAAAAGLEVWWCPFTNNLTGEEVVELVADCAERAERLRQRGAEIVLLTGSELSLFTAGFIPGDNLQDRLTVLADISRVRALVPGIRAGMDALLDKAVAVARSRFGGKLSYASLPFEGVNWGRFDIISTDAGYRTGPLAARFREDMRAFAGQGRAQGKPVAITEFGCAAYRDAGTLADRDDAILEWGPGARPVRLKRDLTRDEDEQARYIRELVDVFETEGVDAAFVYTFARYDLAHRPNAHEDFDRASKGVVKVLEGRTGERYPDMPWEPKAAFSAFADCYGALDR
ncbi:MAG TPA: hypothetical protein VG456_25825 [Candidatus Sulfopaludibacter sp.]|jgi:hypothetical protein|nr:hypothetical protein [Candidatus Sulfopaludibacter sp.]